MSRTLIFLILFFIPLSGFTQNAELDSLIGVLKSETVRDTTRVNRLIEVHGHLILSDASATLPYVEEAMSISKEVGFTTGIGFCENALGMYHLYHNENKEKALEHVLRSVEILDSIGDKKHIIISYNNLGLVYQRLDRYEDSQVIYERMFRTLEPQGVTNNLLAACNNLGLAFHYTENYEKALEWYGRLHSLSEEINSPFGMMMANGNISRVFEEKADYSKMLVYSKKALQQSKKLGAVQKIAIGYQSVGRASGELGDFKKAVYHLKKADSMAVAIGDLDMSVNSRAFLATYLEQAGDPTSALKFLKLSHQAKDSILANENSKNVEEMRVKFKTEEAVKDKELAELASEKANLENEQNRNMAVGAGLIALLIVLLAGLQMNRMRSKRKAELLAAQLQQNEEESRWKEELRQSQMSALKSQMNPHFIFNAMNSVQSLFYADEKEKASKYLGKFSKLMRSVLEMSDQPTVSLYKEIDALTSYLDLENLRFEGNFNFNIIVNENIDDEMVKIPSMLIQPYVENAIKHGLLHKEGNSELSINIHQPDSQHLKVEVQDNGVGRQASEEIRKAKNPEHQSFASNATATRLDLLNNNRSNKLTVSYDDLTDEKGKPAGTKVSILIPLEA